MCFIIKGKIKYVCSIYIYYFFSKYLEEMEKKIRKKSEKKCEETLYKAPLFI